MYKFTTPETKTANAIHVIALTFHTTTGVVDATVARGHLDEPTGVFTEYERSLETIPREAVTPEVDALAHGVLAWVYSYLRTSGIIPEGAPAAPPVEVNP